MKTALKIAEHYFNLSNESNFDDIKKLFLESTTYNSQNTGLYVGVKNIIKMQKTFHSNFEMLRWNIISINETKPGVVLIDYDFEAKTKDQQIIKSSGLEYVVVLNGKIVHIEIRNK